MIVSKDINPERDFYFLGAKIIEIIDSDEKNDLLSVFQKLKSTENISFNLFSLSLDWLYIIGAIEEPENGLIVKCF